MAMNYDYFPERLQPCYLLQESGIPCIVWFEDALLYYGVPVLLHALHVLVPDINEAADVLVRKDWTLITPAPKKIGNALLRDLVLSLVYPFRILLRDIPPCARGRAQALGYVYSPFSETSEGYPSLITHNSIVLSVFLSRIRTYCSALLKTSAETQTSTAAFRYEAAGSYSYNSPSGRGLELELHNTRKTRRLSWRRY